MTAREFYNVWARVNEPGQTTSWHVLDGDLSRDDAARRESAGNQSARQHGTNLEYRSMPGGQRPID